MIQTTRSYPEYLIDRRIWYLWNIETDEKGRKTKIPYSANYNGRASSTNPSTWATFNRAMKCLQEDRFSFKGIGVAVSKSDRLVFIDIDHCIDEEGRLNEVARDIVDHMKGQFIEVSQSGSGIHILTLGEIPKNFKNSNNGVEMYCEKRFVSLTGNAIETGEPHEDVENLRYIFEKYKTPDKPKTIARRQNIALQRDDQWVIEHAMKRGKFADLYAGHYKVCGYNSQSEADLSLCNILAFWTDCNPEQMDRIFRSSSLYRDKWEREDYRNTTIETAIASCNLTISEYAKKEGSEFERAFLERW